MASIVRTEQGTRTTSPEDVSAILAVLGVTGQERSDLLDLSRRADEPLFIGHGASGIRRELASLISFEKEAERIMDVSPLLIPGLLQTSHYARKVITASGVPAADVEMKVTLRNGRRDVLHRTAQPAQYEAFLGESALRCMIGGAGVMADQLRYLIAEAQRPNISIRS